MSCIYFEKDNLDTQSLDVQAEHLKSCALCRQRREFENEIMLQASQLQSFNPDAALWEKIESSFNTQKIQARPRILKIVNHSKLWLSAAAVIIAIFTFSVFYIFSGGSDKILSDGALLRVEYTEQNYIDAIEQLEKEATPKMAGLDLDLMLLYRDKLETIDQQIEHCRVAIKNNPGNAHIRRYMLAALQDKEETLQEILSI